MTDTPNAERAPGSAPDIAWPTDALEVDLSAALSRLHGDLVDRATAEGLVEIGYTVVDSPVGPLLLAATDVGLVRVAFAGEDHDRVLDALALEVGARILRTPAAFEGPAHQLDEYFAGTRTAFDVPLDLRLTRGFRRTVVEHLSDIEYGNTASYATVARSAGSPRAVRAVGTACATNPVPIVVPCHRVVRSDGSLGRYRGGDEAKRVLLALEAGS